MSTSVLKPGEGGIISTQQLPSRQKNVVKKPNDNTSSVQWVSEHPENWNKRRKARSPIDPNPSGDIIFLNSDFAHTDGNERIRSMLMKEYWRKKRLREEKKKKGEPAGAQARRPRKLSPLQTKLAGQNATSSVPIVGATARATPTDPAVKDYPHDQEPDDSPTALKKNRAIEWLSTDQWWTEEGIDAWNDLQRHFLSVASVFPDLHYDPVRDLDPQLPHGEYDFLRRYHKLPNMLLEIPDAGQTCQVFNMPLASKFPVLIQCFVSLASRVFDRKEALSESPRSLRYHTRVVQLVHEEMQRTERDNDSILLGILGAMISNLIARSRTEFGIHSRGLSNFVQSRGYPSYDPDVMSHYISTLLMCGCQVVEALFGSPTSGPPFKPPLQADISEFLIAKDTLINLLLTAQDQLDNLPIAATSPSDPSSSPLFGSSSVFSAMAWRPLLRPTTNFWKKAFEIAHHPFLILYMYLFNQDLSHPSVSPSARFETESSLAEDFFTRNITKTSHCACINWLVLTKYKWQSERAYLALQLNQVILRLRDENRKVVLRLLLWGLCPLEDWDERPRTTREIVVGLGEEAVEGLIVEGEGSC